MEWIQWWTAAQPQWRVAQGWPFAKGDTVSKDWGHLLEGGKDGMFLVVVSLAWWISAQDSSEESELDNAIEDVAWVLGNLNFRLSMDATTSGPPPVATSSDSSPVSLPSMPKRSKPTRVYGKSKESSG